jgi:phage gp29-like protein
MKDNIKSVIATRNKFLNFISKYIQPLPNPDKVLSRIGGDVSVYRELKNDAHIYSCIQSRKSGVLSLKWEINRGVAMTPIAQFIVGVFDGLNLYRIINDILEATLFGYVVMEILWQYYDGKLIPVDVIAKPQEWFYPDESNMWRFRDASIINGVILPPKKFFVVTHNASYDNPYGEALLSKCYWPVFYKKEVVKFWATFTEKYGMPFIAAKVPLGTSREEIYELQMKLEDLRQDGTLAYEGEDVDIAILDAAKSSSPDLFQKFIQFFNAEISKAILSQTLTTEQGDTGSYAMSQTHFDVRQDVVDADRRIVEYWLNKLIEWTIYLNYPDSSEIPSFVMYQEEDVDMALADRDSKIAATNQVRFTKDYWKRNYGFQDDEIEVMAPVAVFADDPNQHSIDNIKDRGLKDFDDATQKIIGVILEMIKNGSSYEQIERGLIELFPKLDTSEIEDFIAKSILIADAGGRMAVAK